jgi:hypothetical protein
MPTDESSSDDTQPPGTGRSRRRPTGRDRAIHRAAILTGTSVLGVLHLTGSALADRRAPGGSGGGGD